MIQDNRVETSTVLAQMSYFYMNLLGPSMMNAGTAFDKGEKAAEETEKTVQELHAKIGQLTMENGVMDSRYNIAGSLYKVHDFQFEDFSHAQHSWSRSF